MLHALITRFSLAGVFVGSGVEGEPFAIAGGLLAHRGLVTLWAAMVAAILGAFAIDLFWFLLGRRYRGHRWVRAARRRPAFARSLALIERHSVLAILLFRFAYGIRAVAPVAVGTSSVPTGRFVLVSAIAALVWGGLFTFLGFWFGAALGDWADAFAIFGIALGVGLFLASLIGLRGSNASPPVKAE